MRLRRLALIAAGCAVSQIDPAPARAGIMLLPARFDEVLDQVYRGAQADPESFDDVVDGGQGHAVMHAATTGGALPTAAVSITADSFESASASARVDFQVAVEQIVAGSLVAVPIVVTSAGDASVTVDGSGGALAAARITVTGAGETRTTACAPPENYPGAECGGEPFDATLDVAALPGAVLTVTIEALASGGPGASGGSLAASASVDPIVAIDPAFPRRDEFRLVFSAGVNPVPEPTAGAGALAAIAGVLALDLLQSSRVVATRSRRRRT